LKTNLIDVKILFRIVTHENQAKGFVFFFSVSRIGAIYQKQFTVISLKRNKFQFYIATFGPPFLA